MNDKNKKPAQDIKKPAPEPKKEAPAKDTGKKK